MCIRMGKETLHGIKHLAIIMDGNGRWAKERNKERSFGHKEGAKNVRTITKYASLMGIKYLTLYAFSTENWNRPKTEVSILMKLLSEFLKTEVNMLIENNIRFNVIGDMNKLSKSLQQTIEKTKNETRECTGMMQIIAINYGAHDEILRAAKKASEYHSFITKDILENHLDTATIPPVDLLIRTGGDFRLSNFLLWQSSHSELFFSKTLWPDFTEKELSIILSQYNKEETR